MTQEELQFHAHRQPFHPFRVVIDTGETFDIRHPNLILVGRRSAVLGVTNNPDAIVYDWTFQVDLAHIVDIEEPPLIVSG